MTDLDSTPNSLPTTTGGDPPPPPPPRWHHDDAAGAPRVRLMCSLGGRILPRPHDNQLRYVGGDTRIVGLHRTATFSCLHDKLAKIAASPDVAIKYQLPNEDLDALISVTTDEDVENMMEEYDRLAQGSTNRTPRLRLFLFPPGESGGFGSILEGTGSKRDSWFLDVLNGGIGRLERGRSEASSLVSEVPDYLFGLDNDETKTKARAAHEIASASDPGSPAPPTLSPKFSSTSSAAPPDLPPVKTKTEEIPIDPPVQQYASNPVWQYMPEPVPVYYMQGGNIPVRPVPMPVQYFNQTGPVAGGQVPVGYRQPGQGVWSNPSHGGPVYLGGPQIPVDGGGVLLRNPGVIPVFPAGGEAPVAAGMEMRIGRASQ